MIMIANAFVAVFRNWRYTLLAGIIALIVFAFATWLPNVRLLFSILVNPLVPLSDKFMLPLNLIGSIATSFTLRSAFYIIASALLAGINVSLITYYVRRERRISRKGAAAGSLGLLSGILGVGCAACGSLVVMSAFGTAVGASIIAFLPLKGDEFRMAGVVLLSICAYASAKQITKPLVC